MCKALGSIFPPKKEFQIDSLKKILRSQYYGTGAFFLSLFLFFVHVFLGFELGT
jgi:hypothetical protein